MDLLSRRTAIRRDILKMPGFPSSSQGIDTTSERERMEGESKGLVARISSEGINPCIQRTAINGQVNALRWNFSPTSLLRTQCR